MSQSEMKKTPPAKPAPVELRWRSSTIVPGSRLAEKQASLLAVLHASVRDSVPLSPMVRALASEYPPGSYSSKLYRIAYLLDQGVPWLEAIEQTPGALRSDAELALRIGQQSGITLSTFEQLRAENSEELIDYEKSNWQAYLAYWLSVSLVMLFLLSFFSWFIAPTLVKMLQEFGMERGISNIKLVMQYCVLPVVIMLGLTFIGIVLNWSESLRLWISSLLGLPARTSTQHASSLFRILANTTENGRPMSGTLSTLAKYHSDPEMRNKLLVARNEIEQGVQEWDSLRSVGILTDAQRDAMQDLSRDNQAWVLRSLARSLSTHESYRWSWMQSIVHPLVLVFFGFAVLGISTAFLDGLYSLVSDLAKETNWR